MGKILVIRKYIAQQVFADFLRWVKANAITISQPPLSELIDEYLKATYGGGDKKL